MGIILERVGLPASGYSDDLGKKQNGTQGSTIVIDQERQKIINAVGLEDSDEESGEQGIDKVVVTQEDVVNMIVNPVVNVGDAPKTQFSTHRSRPDKTVISVCHRPIKNQIDLSVLQDIPIPPTVKDPLKLKSTPFKTKNKCKTLRKMKKMTDLANDWSYDYGLPSTPTNSAKHFT